MKVAIIGASGLIGGQLHELALINPLITKVLGTHYSYSLPNTVYLDVTGEFENAKRILKEFQPDWIIHTGALTHVDYCEEHVEESYEKTVGSTINLLQIAKELKASFLYISTDYVFDGKSGPYLETDVTNPLSVYGRHKLLTEKEVTESGVHSIIVRVTNVYGDEVRGKNFVSRLWKALETNDINIWTLPMDQYATPINAGDVARAIFTLINDNEEGIWHLAGTDYLNRISLAKIVSLAYNRYTFSNTSLHLNITTTALMNQSAVRPLQGGLKTNKFTTKYPDFHFGSVWEYLLEKYSK